MDDNGEIDQEEVMLPGFRFHPTDEELVGFYLKKKVEQKPLAIQLIRQLNIYKYEPWDLPKLAITGEKEWYFCCQRDRKYRNSSRSNRLTGAGFWKATGIDRPIYSSDGTKRIGLKKSLVFYKGRAAKGIKTDWMMHELRLPSLSDSSPANKPFNKNIPNSDSWAIYRIFKKIKTNSLAQKALPRSTPSSLPEITDVGQLSFKSSTSMNQVGSTNGLHSQQQQQHTNTRHPPDATSCKPSSNSSCKHSLASISSSQMPASFMFSPVEMPVPTKSLSDVASRLHNISPRIFTDGVREDLPMEVIQNLGNGGEEISMKEVMRNTCTAGNDHLETMQANNFPLDMPPRLCDEWKITYLQWDSSSYPIEMTSYHTNES